MLTVLSKWIKNLKVPLICICWPKLNYRITCNFHFLSEKPFHFISENYFFGRKFDGRELRIQFAKNRKTEWADFNHPGGRRSRSRSRRRSRSRSRRRSRSRSRSRRRSRSPRRSSSRSKRSRSKSGSRRRRSRNSKSSSRSRSRSKSRQQPSRSRSWDETTKILLYFIWH